MPCISEPFYIKAFLGSSSFMSVCLSVHPSLLSYIVGLTLEQF